MDSLRILSIASVIGAAMVGGLYAAASSARADGGTESTHHAPSVPVADIPVADGVTADIPVADEVAAEEIPFGLDPPDEVAALVDAYAEEVLVPETGLRFGLRVVPAFEHLESSEPIAVRRVAHSREPAAPIVRLSPDPGRNVILTARGMMSRGETVRGSCYAYLSEVFARAGNEGWRTRTIVHRSAIAGPYANLDSIRPGDWLYIVNHPEATPVGTHSVLFVSWEDRARGYARVIEHPGWGAGPSAGQERGYDISRTYRIVRPTLPH